MKNRLAFTESCVYTNVSIPPCDPGGYLETKRGELCLRLADTVQATSNTKVVFTRTWRRPGKTPFDQNLYQCKSRPIRG